MVKIILFNFFILLAVTHSYAQSSDIKSFVCNTSIVLSVDKEGQLKQFLPGKIYFKINKNKLVFGKLGYLTDEEVAIQKINENKFYSYKPAQTILYDNGLFHNILFTYEGITAVQAKCKIQKELDGKN